VRDRDAKKHNFEVIVDKGTPAFECDEEEPMSLSKRFGFGQTLDQR
jgi:hypothetical protein